MRVLIVGGTAFIGPYVVAALAALGHEIAVFHRGEHEPDLASGVKHIHSLMAEYPIMKFPAEPVSWKPEVVLHMVCMGERDAEAAVRAFRGVARRLIVPSSGDVYAAYGVLVGSEEQAMEAGLLSEDSPLRNELYPYRKAAKGPDDWIYDYDKILVEKTVMSEPDLPATILRLPAVYGPGDNRHGFLPYLKRMDDRRPAILLDDNQARWRWAHGYVENVAAAITLAIVDDRAAGRVYNVGEEVTPSTEQRLRILAGITGWTGRIVTFPKPLLPLHLRDSYNYSCDLAHNTSRIRRELGYRETISLEEGMRRTILDLRAHPPVCVSAHYDYAAEDAALLRFGASESAGIAVPHGSIERKP